MISRRVLILAGMASSIVPLTAIANPVPARHLDGWEAVIDMMNLEQLKTKYSDMMRNCGPEHYRVAEAAGPLHADWFYRMRQQVYRRIIKLKYGIENPDDPLNPFHFPAIA